MGSTSLRLFLCGEVCVLRGRNSELQDEIVRAIALQSSILTILRNVFLLREVLLSILYVVVVMHYEIFVVKCDFSNVYHVFCGWVVTNSKRLQCNTDYTVGCHRLEATCKDHLKATLEAFLIFVFHKAFLGNETFDYGGGLFDVGGKNPIELVINFLSNANMTAVTGSLEKLLSESYKFIRLADDINDMKNYINDMRLCFVALTISGYVAMLIYAIVLFCGRRNGRNAQRRRHASGMAYMDEESLGWGEKPPTQQSMCNRTTSGDRDPYYYRSSSRKPMHPFSRQRYNITAALTDAAAHPASGDSVCAKVNGPFETSPLNVTETTTSLEAPGAETAH
ncbi:conserved hypothetical protein [Trichinella spiralis]|uniref:hypothetical protein n=1 Tax=Trichinella spiralis TaxID=6334 RepID=UPI0001EFC1B8|nr:conserved hypothetical protein [Trichinella spiralis]